MTPSERANLPRWRGQPGFYEIWFLVIFDPSAERAWWLRFTTFSPIAGPSLTMQWLAEFDRSGGKPTVAKWISPAKEGYRAERDRFALSFGKSELLHGALRGSFQTDRHRFAWDLTFVPADRPRQPLPTFFDRLPSPVHVAHVNSGVQFSGRIEVDGRSITLAKAPGLQKHIWGKRVVERLYWLHCSRFESEPDLEVEVTSVRVREKWSPTLAFAEAHRAGKSVLDTKLFGTKLEPSGPYALSAASGSLRVQARCDPETLVGYKYRDPRGFEVFVAQSDVGHAEVELEGRQTKSRGTTALEFHGMEPLPGVSYLGFEDTGQ